MADTCVDSSANGRSLSVDSPPSCLTGSSDRHEISDARKLGKALRLIEKLKEKCGYEREVNQELAQRNEILKREVKEEGEKLKAVITAFDDLHKICAVLLDENGTSVSIFICEYAQVYLTECFLIYCLIERLLTQGLPTVRTFIYLPVFPQLKVPFAYSSSFSSDTGSQRDIRRKKCSRR
jgi:hypothetical protein